MIGLFCHKDNRPAIRTIDLPCKTKVVSRGPTILPGIREWAWLVRDAGREQNMEAPVPSGVYQCDCFTPKRTLRRSPPPGRAVSEEKENQTPDDHFDKGSLEDANVRGGNRMISPSMRQFILADGTPYQRRVQDACFTPKRTLKRSPATGHFTPSAPGNERLHFGR